MTFLTGIFCATLKVMKRVLLIFTSFILVSFLYFSFSTNVNAQGSCQCSYSVAGCTPWPVGSADPCEDTYHRVCTNIPAQCSPVNPDGCECVSDTPPPPPPAGGCPADRPLCTSFPAGECASRGGVVPTPDCTIFLGITGNCCISNTPPPPPAGQCSCVYGSSGCDIYAESCDEAAGYVATCTNNIYQCSPGYNSCTCEFIDPGADPDCGGTSQPCCAGSLCDTAALQCVGTAAGDRCLGSAQICCLPGGPPPGYDPALCAGVTCGGSAPNSQEFFCNPTTGAASASPNAGGINTAIGCIPFADSSGNPATQLFVTFLLRWGMGIAGGVALILIVYAGILILTSGGNPQKLTAGKELLTAAITGLLLLVFGAFVLDFIGVNILNIPGFGQ